MKTSYLLHTLLILLSQSASADITAWDYDMTSPPVGWSFDPLWEFTTEGVLFDQYVNSPWASRAGEILSPEVTVPASCDSVVLNLEQDLYMHCSGMGGNSEVKVSYRLDGGSWINLLRVLYFLETTDPIHYYIPASAGEVIELKIDGAVWCGSDLHPGSASIDWLLYDLNLTFYGEALSLQSGSWGAIKNSFN